MPEAADIDLSSDQAAGLRRLFGARVPQVVAFASGRESSGRTTLLVRSAAALAAAGHGVVVIDENPAPHNAISAFGLSARHDLMHALAGERPLRQIAIEAAPLLRIVPAMRAARQLHPFDPAHRARLSACLAELQGDAGFVLIDCAARRGAQLSALALAARHLVVVVAAQTSAITHAYAMIKNLAAAGCGRAAFQIVVTRARSAEEARAIFGNMKRLALDQLGVRLDFLGAAIAPAGEHVADALVTRLPPALYASPVDALCPQPLAPHFGNSLMV